MANPIPEGYHTLTPSVSFKDARRAIDFYKRAFGATEKEVYPGAGGKGVMHAEITIGDSIMMVGDESPQGANPSAETLGQSTASFVLYVTNADNAFDKAVAAGAIVDKNVVDLFWGDRGGSVKDPFGYTWWILTHTKDMSKQEIAEAGEAAMRKTPEPAGRK